MSRTRSCLATLAIALLVVATGCSDDSSDPTLPAALTGLVLDAAGQPVAGAAIGLVYRLEETPLPGDWEKASATISYVIPEAGHVRLEVFDHAGQSVIVLVDEDQLPNTYEVVWDAEDSSGQPVPSGVYHYLLSIDDEAPMVRDDLLYSYQPGEIMRAPHAVTDARGRFSVPRDLIPTGESVTYVDEQDMFTEDRIAVEVLVLAVWFEDQMLLTCGAEANLPPDVTHAAVELVFVPEIPTPTF